MSIIYWLIYGWVGANKVDENCYADYCKLITGQGLLRLGSAFCHQVPEQVTLLIQAAGDPHIVLGWKRNSSTVVWQEKKWFARN